MNWEHWGAAGRRSSDGARNACLQRNWRCRYGELDLIVEDTDNTVVFVEVKPGPARVFGGLAGGGVTDQAEASAPLAGVWLGQQTQSWANIRMDVVGVRSAGRRHPR